MWFLLEGEGKEKEERVSLVVRRGRMLSVLERAPRMGLRSGSVAVVTASIAGSAFKAVFAGGQAWAAWTGIVLKGGDVSATDLLDASLASLFACSGGGSQSGSYSRIVRCPVFTKSSSCYSAWCILLTCLCVSNDIACKSNPDVLIQRSHCAALFNCCYLFCLHLPCQPAGGTRSDSGCIFTC